MNRKSPLLPRLATVAYGRMSVPGSVHRQIAECQCRTVHRKTVARQYLARHRQADSSKIIPGIEKGGDVTDLESVIPHVSVEDKQPLRPDQEGMEPP
eukprot:3004581-Rhodomonas_salina.1